VAKRQDTLTKTFAQAAQSDSALQPLYDRLAAYKPLQRSINRSLTGALTGRVRVCDLDAAGLLTLAVDSNAAASSVRQLASRLIAAANLTETHPPLPKVTKLRIRVQVDFAQLARSQPTRAEPRWDLLATITDDLAVSPLKTALQRIIADVSARRR
jgi:hypothetical protein